MGGDFNIDLLKFRENRNINSYLESLISYSYIPTITLPTRLTDATGTLIDNFLVKLTNNCLSYMAGILIQNISDHLPYFIALDILKFKHNAVKYVQISPKCSQSMDNFKQYLQNKNIMATLDTDLNANPDTNYEKLNEIIKSGIENCFPVKTIRFNKYKYKKNPWITEGILISIKYRDSLYKSYKTTSPQDGQFLTKKLNLQTYNRILKRSIRLAKMRYYQHCFDKYKEDMRKTWMTINTILNKAHNKKEFPKYFIMDDKHIYDTKVIADEFHTFFINIGPNLSDRIHNSNTPNFENYLRNSTENNCTFKFCNINCDDVIKIIDSLKAKTSYGHDGISNKVLKYVKQELAQPLHLIINQCISQGQFPNKLKLAKVTPVYKKDSLHIFDNYRPVSVLSSVSKVFERVLFKQLYNFFNEKNLFHSSQYGFRSHHSTELAALEFLDRVMIEMDKGKIPISIFLDLSKAFDTIDHDILIHKLRHYGIRNQALALINSYLNNRYQYVQIENVSSKFLQIRTGVPQGSILGPLLFF